MQLFRELQNSIEKNKLNNAFFINDKFYSYKDFGGKISKIRKALQENTNSEDKNIGIVAYDDLETYAAIVALWFEGKAYVPLSPETPEDRNRNIINQAEIKTIIDSSQDSLFPELNIIESNKLVVELIDQSIKTVSDQENAYILFTSGTTGQPKGVPIARSNVEGFIDAFWNIGFEISEKDRCLQMFELTFDLSVMSYLVPMLKGACIYTIPKDKIKYSYIYELMDDHKLTVALMVPSILLYLRSYFDEIDLPEMRYSLFCGEALPLDVTEEWSKNLPNADIYNVYGPTEDTIFCTYYKFNKNAKNKAHHGILSIGKPMFGTKTIIINEENGIRESGEIGELCLGGVQLTPGYWQNEEKNSEAFFIFNDEKKERFYKTGDLAIMDDEGDILYIGRTDHQIKVQGFRVELSEIEFHSKEYLGKINVVALAVIDNIGNTEIVLVIESDEFNPDPLKEYLKSKLPVYMQPKQIGFTKSFPLNTNGKTDRKKLGLLFNSEK